MRRILRHPMFMPFLALLLGLVAAKIVANQVIVPNGWTVQIPAWLADRLSESGDRNLVLTRPQLLWLVPISVVPFLIAMTVRSLVDVRPFQIATQLFFRVTVLMALALALTYPTLRSPIRGKTVVFVVDVSESIDETQRQAAEAAVRRGLALAADEEAAGVPREDRTRVRVVTYAGDAAAMDLEGVDPATLVLPRDEDNALASDHAAGLRLAQALVEPDTEARVVLFTDGTGDLAERQGLVNGIVALEDGRASVHLRAYEGEARGDVVVEAVHLPDEMRIGQTFDVAVDLVATSPGKAKLHVDKNGKPNPLGPVVEVELKGGKQQVKVPARVTEPGAVTFEARLDTESFPAEENRSTVNDKAAVVGEVRGRPRVLHVGTDSTGALVRALGVDHLQVDNVAPSEIPESAEALRRYDLVVFSDLPARRVPTAQQQAVARYVKEYGGGFIMVGGENSFGTGGWGGTPIESVLPVRFSGERQREQPTLALVLVIDKSGSMSSEDKIDLVKEAARSTARTLDPSDEIGIIGFDSRPQVLVRLQAAANRLRISSSIRRLQAGGGTNILPALREAYLQLAGSKALIKHVILLSDGQSNEGGINSLVGDMRAADITVSTVGVGAGAGKELLARVAERGRGRYYFSQDGTDVPRIFSRETREVTRNALVERQLYPRVTKAVQALRGIDFSRAPGLRGIVPVKPKSQTETLLRTHLGDPLLVRGRRGLGRVAAFASDAKPRWATSWIGWGGFAKFWSQLARDTMRQGAGMLGGAEIRVSPAAEAGAWNVVVDVESPQGFANDLEGEVTIIDPSIPKDAEDPEGLREREVTLALTAPGRYEATVHDISAGQRLLKAKLYDATINPRRLAAEAVTNVSVPYPAELAPQHLEPNYEWLRSLTTTGSVEGSVDAVVTKPGNPQGRKRSKPLWPVVLWGLALPLMLLDLFVRRISFGVRRVEV